MEKNKKHSQRGKHFPIVEAYGFPYDSNSDAALETWDGHLCPFAGGPCEKKRQYNYGYCSVTYAARWDKGEQHTYAVCDHRLDGAPVKWAMTDYFGDDNVVLVPEVTVKDEPKLNIDYVAYADQASDAEVDRVIAIETQAIDLRGGGVGPAWEAWEKKDTENWRSYFTAEARRKGRRDTVDYGVNTGNVYKRLGTQVAVKGEFLKQIHVPLYVVMQHCILQQLRSRIDFRPAEEDTPWDISFVGFDYDGTYESNGQLKLSFIEVVRTTLDDYVTAMMSSGDGVASRKDLIARARKKSGTSPGQSELPYFT